MNPFFHQLLTLRGRQSYISLYMDVKMVTSGQIYQNGWLSSTASLQHILQCISNRHPSATQIDLRHKIKEGRNTSVTWNRSWEVSFKKSAIMQPRNRPKGISNSRSLEMESRTSDKELATRRINENHFNAFFPRIRRRWITISSAFFHGNSLADSGKVSCSLSLKCSTWGLSLLSSPNSLLFGELKENFTIRRWLQVCENEELWLGRYLWPLRSFVCD